MAVFYGIKALSFLSKDLHLKALLQIHSIPVQITPHKRVKPYLKQSTLCFYNCRIYLCGYLVREENLYGENVAMAPGLGGPLPS